MSNLLELIKQAALDAIEQSKPVKLVFGTVIGKNPLMVRVEQKLTLEKSFFIINETAQNCSVGDRVIMLRMQGGQSYLILDKVVD